MSNMKPQKYRLLNQSQTESENIRDSCQITSPCLLTISSPIHSLRLHIMTEVWWNMHLKPNPGAFITTSKSEDSVCKRRLNLAALRFHTSVTYLKKSTTQRLECVMDLHGLFCILKGVLVRSPESRVRLCSCVREAVLWILHTSWINRLWQLCALELNTVFSTFWLLPFLSSKLSVGNAFLLWFISQSTPTQFIRFCTRGLFVLIRRTVTLFFRNSGALHPGFFHSSTSVKLIACDVLTVNWPEKSWVIWKSRVS